MEPWEGVFAKERDVSDSCLEKRFSGNEDMLVHIFKSLHLTVNIKHLNTELISSIPCSPLPSRRLSCAAFPLEVLFSLLPPAWHAPIFETKAQSCLHTQFLKCGYASR